MASVIKCDLCKSEKEVFYKVSITKKETASTMTYEDVCESCVSKIENISKARKPRVKKEKKAIPQD